MIVNNRGFTIPELLIASAMTLIAVSGIVTFSSVWKRNYDKSYATYMAVALESALLSAMVDPETYTPAIQTKLAKNANLNQPVGQKPALGVGKNGPEIPFELTGLDTPNGEPLKITTNTPVFISPEFNDCKDNFDNPRCRIRLEVRAKKLPSGLYAYAYDLQLNPKLHTPSQSTLKRSPPGGAVVDPWSLPESYTVPIPNSLFKQTSAGACDQNSIGVMGVNRDTGQVTCIKKSDPNLACSKGSLPIGIFVNANNEIQFKCSPPEYKPKCDDNYSLYAVSPVAAAKYASPLFSGCMVTTTEKTVGPADPAQLKFGEPGKYNISGRVCPPNYKSKSTCELVPDKVVNATCQTTCPGMVPNPAFPADPTAPAQIPGMVPCNLPVNAVPGTITPAGAVNNKRDVTCVYTEQPQGACNGAWLGGIAPEYKAHPLLKVTCESIVTPITKGAK